LRLSNPGLELHYPPDPEDHFAHVNEALKNLTQPHRLHCYVGYCGPWMENNWIEHFGGMWSKRKAGTRLIDIFGPYIPLLVPWADTAKNLAHRYPKLLEGLRAILRPDVPYITVSQHALGVFVKSEYKLRDFPNLLVLSGGGTGHVPLVLLKKLLSPKSKPVEQRRFLLSFMGTLKNGPDHFRGRMKTTILMKAQELNVSDKIHISHGGDWREIMADSRFHLTPRGYGRTSFLLGETLQMGLIPIHIYSDIPWVPYRSRFEDLGFITNLSGLGDLVERLSSVGDAEIKKREARILAVRDTHFTPAAQLEQISAFMTGQRGGGDLECQKTAF